MRSLSCSLRIWIWKTLPKPGMCVREFLMTFRAYRPSSEPTRTIWTHTHTHTHSRTHTHTHTHTHSHIHTHTHTHIHTHKHTHTHTHTHTYTQIHRGSSKAALV